MVDFRKVLLTLIVGALLFATVGSAQFTNPYSCNATAVPTLARSEGIAERMEGGPELRRAHTKMSHVLRDLGTRAQVLAHPIDEAGFD